MDKKFNEIEISNFRGFDSIKIDRLSGLNVFVGANNVGLGICYEGGLDERGLPADTRTYAQRCTLLDLLRQLRRDYPSARILGHYQLSTNIRKACPCFDAEKEYQLF